MAIVLHRLSSLLNRSNCFSPSSLLSLCSLISGHNSTSQNPKTEMAFVSSSLLSYLSYRTIFASTSLLCNPGETPKILTPPAENPMVFNLGPRTRTPLEKQFETWIDKLKPGFTPTDVDDALLSQSDPDLALDIFRWTAQQRCYKHNHVTYHTMFNIAVTGKRYGHAETLMEEVLAGACSGSVTLYNSMIRFCCSEKRLFNRAFDVYKKMQKLSD